MEKQVKEQQELDECTFSPNISQNKLRYVRHPDEFYKDQKMLEMWKMHRIGVLEKQIEDKTKGDKSVGSKNKEVRHDKEGFKHTMLFKKE